MSFENGVHIADVIINGTEWNLGNERNSCDIKLYKRMFHPLLFIMKFVICGFGNGVFWFLEQRIWCFIFQKRIITLK
jgi:hypothetical protein